MKLRFAKRKPKKKRRYVDISITLSNDDYEYVKAAAKRKGLTINQYIVRVIKQHLRRLGYRPATSR